MIRSSRTDDSKTPNIVIQISGSHVSSSWIEHRLAVLLDVSAAARQISSAGSLLQTVSYPTSEEAVLLSSPSVTLYLFIDRTNLSVWKVTSSRLCRTNTDTHSCLLNASIWMFLKMTLTGRFTRCKTEKKVILSPACVYQKLSQHQIMKDSYLFWRKT